MVPFGLAQAPAYFQLLMNKVLEGLLYVMTYLMISSYLVKMKKTI